MAGEDPAPPSLDVGEHVFDVAMGPTHPLVASATISGRVLVHEYGLEGNTLRHDLRHHSESCRCLLFTKAGDNLYTGSKDLSIHRVNMETGGTVASFVAAHEEPINTIATCFDETIASGDDKGVIKLWDPRQGDQAVATLEDHEDFVAALHFVEDKTTLLSVSGDGTLGCYDMRKRKLVCRSDNQEDELLSLVVAKGGRKVVVGSQGGILDIFSWGKWRDVSDRFPGHPQSVDTMLAVSDDVVVTGSSDGLIRVVQILPNKLLGIVGDHKGFPIEKLSVSHDRTYVASCSHDEAVHFWNLKFLYDDEYSAPEAEKPTYKKRRRKRGDDDSSDDDESSDEDDEGGDEDGDDAGAAGDAGAGGAELEDGDVVDSGDGDKHVDEGNTNTSEETRPRDTKRAKRVLTVHKEVGSSFFDDM